jgi:hypothetical protein
MLGWRAAKYFLDPGHAPSARELADGLRITAERMMARGPDAS